MRKTFCTVILFISAIANAQEKIEFIDHENLNNKIIQYSKSKDYDSIIAAIDKVNKNDSIYSKWLVTKSYYQIQQKKYDDVIITTNEGLGINDELHKISFIINQSLAYASLKNFDEALNVLNKAIKEHPKNHKLHHSKAYVYEIAEKYPEAVENYQKAIALNPFYPDSHLRLGNICYKQHLTTQALMCINLYLLLNPDGGNSFSVLNSMDKLLTQKNQKEKTEGLIISEDDNGFDEINLILDNRIAIDADYSTGNEINIAYVKQNHAMLQMLDQFEGGNGLWEKTYVPFHKWIKENEHFDNFIYTTNYSIKNEKFAKIVKNKKADVIKFIDLFKTEWENINEIHNVSLKNKEEKVSYIYELDNVDAIGSKKNGVPSGYWEFFTESGKLRSQGNFNNEGKRDNKWKWFHNNGKTEETVIYSNTQLNGKAIGYFDNGNVEYEGNYKDGLLHGPYKYFNKYGAPIQNKKFEKGTLNGPFLSYYPGGEEYKEYEVNYTDDKLTGSLKKYYPNGQIARESNYQNGKIVGIEKEYYSNGKLQSETEMKSGRFDGYFKSYHKNGNIKEQGMGLEGQSSGNWKQFYPDGALKNEYQFKKGKLDGQYLEYTPEGWLYYEYSYRNDELIAYKYFDQNKQVLKEAKKKSGRFIYEGRSAEGNIIAEGEYNVKGGKEGEWIFYTKNGTVDSKGAYKEDKPIGKHLGFHSNNKVSQESNHKDGKYEGYYVSYYNTGQMSSQGWYVDDNPHKEWRYYNKNGDLSSINFYHKGNLHGKQQYFSSEGKLNQEQVYKYDELVSIKNYDIDQEPIETIIYPYEQKEFTITAHYRNKQTKSITNYKYGLRDGPYIEYGDNGNILITGGYQNGSSSGKWIWYHKNGNKKTEVNFVNGVYDGSSKTFYEDGSIESDYTYDLGDLVGTSYYYEETNGTITTKSEYLNGQLHGKRYSYSNEGKLQLIRWYQYNRLIGYCYLNTDGNELAMIPIKNETAKITSYFDNGKKAREFEIVNGNYENKYTSYFYNGMPQREFTNTNGNYQGAYKSYYPNGQVKEETNYKDDEKNGLYKTFYNNGQLKEEANYINDGKTGISKYYNEKGKLIKTAKYFNDTLYEVQEF